MTDPEILEMNFPVRVEAFYHRIGSGGAGKYKGGDGVVRRIRFLKEMTVNIISTRRDNRPLGINGGKPGLPGVNIYELACGKRILLDSCVTLSVYAGDLIEISTPGGGGWG
jgi:5-oxoprolinase (ATP-hydrolysing)